MDYAEKWLLLPSWSRRGLVFLPGYVKFGDLWVLSHHGLSGGLVPSLAFQVWDNSVRFVGDGAVPIGSYDGREYRFGAAFGGMELVGIGIELMDAAVDFYIKLVSWYYDRNLPMLIDLPIRGDRSGALVFSDHSELDDYQIYLDDAAYDGYIHYRGGLTGHINLYEGLFPIYIEDLKLHLSASAIPPYFSDLGSFGA